MIDYGHITITYRDKEYQARPLTGRQAERILAIVGTLDEDSPEGVQASLRAQRYVVACCLLEDGKPKYQGETDIDRVSDEPFTLIQKVSEAVMAEAGLGEAPKGN